MKERNPMQANECRAINHHAWKNLTVYECEQQLEESHRTPQLPGTVSTNIYTNHSTFVVCVLAVVVPAVQDTWNRSCIESVQFSMCQQQQQELVQLVQTLCLCISSCTIGISAQLSSAALLLL
jgi:hypothetical protein